MTTSARARSAIGSDGDVVNKLAALRTDTSALVQQVDAIKRLMIVAMLRSGMGQRDVAKALGVDQSAISRMFKGIGRRALSRTSPVDES
jgi:transposase-like protein